MRLTPPDSRVVDHQIEGRGSTMICHPLTRIQGIRVLQSLLVDRRILVVALTICEQRGTEATEQNDVK